MRKKARDEHGQTGQLHKFFLRKRTLRFLLFLCLSVGYWVQSAPSYDLAGMLSLSLASLPVLLMVFRVAFVIILLALLPVVKGKPRFVNLCTLRGGVLIIPCRIHREP
jgi:hypothetical protein